MPVDVLELWDFGDPSRSEKRFREAMGSAAPQDAFVLKTQIARSFGMRSDFERAKALLADLEPELESASSEGRVRYHLELGRAHCSPAHPPDSQDHQAKETGRREFMRAYDLAKTAGHDYLALDALHMMTMVDTDPADQMAWNRRAIEYMESADEPLAKRWEGSLRHNMGYALHLDGQYDEALRQFELSKAANQAASKDGAVRVANWMIARTYRVMGRSAEALEIQLGLEKERDELGQPSPYAFEELATLYGEMGDTAMESHYLEKQKVASS
jgi:tetratricopeptide (TPR) repeat protein